MSLFTDAKNPVGQCPVKSSVISIVPVRYAIDDQRPDPNFPGNPDKQIGKHPLPKEEHWQGPLQLKENTYTLRQLRNGWLYVYDETAETFHEYQVTGHDLIKIDWGSNEADSDTEKRGSPGETQPFLNYPSQNKLYIAYSAHRWSWRVCEHMRSDSSSRHQWMRGVNLKQFCHTLKSPDAGYIDDLADRVADIYDGAAPDETTFINTCTPLKKPENSAEPEALYPLVAEKPATAKGAVMKGMPDPTTAMFVALDDPLGDITDLVLQLAGHWAEKEAILGSEDEVHKFRMAEVARMLGRVQVSPDQLPAYLKAHPVKALEFETSLNAYLKAKADADEAMQENSLVNMAAYRKTEAAREMKTELSQMLPNMAAHDTTATDAQKAELKNVYEFHVTEAMEKQWSEQHIFDDEVDWDALMAYLTSHYQLLEGKDDNIKVGYREVVAAIEQLEDEALSVGVDTQVEADVSYLLSLVSQTVTILKLATLDDEHRHQFETAFSPDSPKNLFALATFGFSKDSWQAIQDVRETLNQMWSASNQDDVTALSSIFNNWSSLIGDARVQEKAWFKALVLPAQQSFTALKEAVSGSAASSWQSLMDLAFPLKWEKGARGLIDNFRVVLLEAMMSDSAVLVANPNYARDLQSYQNRVSLLLNERQALLDIKPGQAITKKHYLNSLKSIQRRLQNLTVHEPPTLLMLKENRFNQQARQVVNEYLTAMQQGSQKAATTVRQGIGGWGRAFVILGIWNVIAAMDGITDRLKQAHSYTDYAKAVLEPIYDTLYTVTFVYGIALDRAWSAVSVNSDLMKLTLKESTEQGIESKLALRFSNLLKTVAFIGMVASALETYDSYLKMNDALNDPMETLGYRIKMIATGGNVVIFSSQLLFRAGSLLFRNLGLNTISYLLAPWMLTGFFVLSVLYLVALVIINRYHRTDLEKWLRQSVWGKTPAGWSAWEEAARLEEFFSRPQVILKGVENPAIKITSLYQSTHQWQLLIDLPPFVAGKIIGLQITRMPQQQPGQIYLTAPTPALLNEQQGQFERIEQDGKQLIRYTLNCGGSTADIITVAIQMPLSWIDTKDPDDKIRTISYLCSGNKRGAQAVNPQHEFNLKIDPTKRAIKVEV